MTDINKNVGADQIAKLHNLNFEGAKSTADVDAPKNYTDKEIKNLDNDHSALVGRSMIKKMSKGPNFDGRIVGNIKADLKEFNENPELVTKADAVFNAALAKGYSYDKATAMALEFVNFHK